MPSISTRTGLLRALLVALLGMIGPLQAQAEPAVCKIGVNLEDLYDLDPAKDTFGAALWIWSLCPSDQFTPLMTLEFPTAAPGLNQSAPIIRPAADGGQYMARRVQGTFRYNWNMSQYPFDSQTISIPIDETDQHADSLVFEADTQQSFLTPEIRERLSEWKVSDLTLQTSVSEEESTYGVPGATNARFARLDISFTLERQQVMAFLKLTAGVYAGVFIAFLSFFYDPNDRGAFGGKLGLLVGVLFATLVNLRSADTMIGDSGQQTLVTMIHLITLVLIVTLALIALRDRRRSERGVPVRHPDWPTLAMVGAVYLFALVGLIAHAALT